jgi:hypothetical protein
MLRSSEGRQAVGQAVSQLFGLIKKRSADVIATGNFKIDVMLGQKQCHVRNDRVSLTLTLTDRDFGMELVIAEYDKPLAVGNEHLFYPDGGPTQVSESKFSPDLNRAREVGWADNAKPTTFVSSTALAENVVIRFINLTERAERGDFRHSCPSRYGGRRR